MMKSMNKMLLAAAFTEVAAVFKCSTVTNEQKCNSVNLCRVNNTGPWKKECGPRKLYQLCEWDRKSKECLGIDDDDAKVVDKLISKQQRNTTDSAKVMSRIGADFDDLEDDEALIVGAVDMFNRLGKGAGDQTSDARYNRFKAYVGCALECGLVRNPLCMSDCFQSNA